MNTRSLLDQLLSSGKELLQTQHTAQSHQTHQAGSTQSNTDISSLLGNIGGGALGGGMISLLMSSKKARKVGGNVATYGGLAGLGFLAYKAYSNWQNNNINQAQPPQHQPQTVDRVSQTAVEMHSQAILRAIISAAKADGHIDEREQQLIDDAIAKLTNEPQLQLWFQQEMQKPVDPTALAREAKSSEIAAEMYLASILVMDEENYMERAYLDELARQLQLAPELKKELETQAIAHLR
ncbi:tellurite resistance TerB family protein [Oceanisphaera avium]|uniref:Protein YebE n=1 Tax=Oceanisphaera avium TaxID=1903694 RepID=A0A1Y0CXX5_9GAMM|nr:tellurite resistance TerB family protein [Oceanisphaera avium]ART80171.1 hypothetical protein CBP12_08430 [Oceanisphaera avium]